MVFLRHFYGRVARKPKKSPSGLRPRAVLLAVFKYLAFPLNKGSVLNTLEGEHMATKETPQRHNEDGLPIYPTRYGMRTAREAANALFEKSGEAFAPGRLAEGRPP